MHKYSSECVCKYVNNVNKGETTREYLSFNQVCELSGGYSGFLVLFWIKNCQIYTKKHWISQILL